MHVLHRSHTAGTSSEAGTAFVDTQPRLSKLSIRGLLTLPYRLCNPPPAVGKVRSCGLTPLFKVQLEDVLARKHLPPLSLKDFEEWLLFIEQSPENLYFVLWLREYERKWTAWERRQQRNHQRSDQHTDVNDVEKGVGGGSSRVTFSPGSALSPSLALSFERARATFCTPGAPYELCVPPELLAPFFTSPSPSSHHTHAPSSSSPTHHAHPHPRAFAPLSAHLHTRLRASLQRCVRAAYSNVGTFRATCGIVGGTTITLLFAGIPLLIEFVVQEARGSRWTRLAALPGLWLGLTIIVASLRGVCMMVYVFGDFRQLRRFELERPPAPAPVPVPAHAAQSCEREKTQEGTARARRSRSRSAGTRGSAPATDERRKSNASLVSASSLTSSSSIYSTSSNPTNPMAAHVAQSTYVKKPAQLHVHTPIRALTAPPRIAVRIPEGRSASFSVVSSERRSSISIPARSAGDGDEESIVSEGDSDSESDSDADSDTSSDHGIYVSPQYAPPDELAALDAQGVQAALAMARRMAGEAQQLQNQLQQYQQTQIDVGDLVGADELGGGAGGESPVSIVVSGEAAERMLLRGDASSGVDKDLSKEKDQSKDSSSKDKDKEKEKEPTQPQQTARFIPAYEYEVEERDTWECDSPTSSSGGSAASGSGSGGVAGSGVVGKGFVCPVKKRVTALFSSSGSGSNEKEKEKENGVEGGGEEEDEAARGPCWNIRTRTRSRSSGGRRSRTTSLGSRSVASARINVTTTTTTDVENVDLEKGLGVEENSCATTTSKRGRSRKRRAAREADQDASTTTTPFDFDSLPPREGRPPRQAPVVQLQSGVGGYNFNLNHQAHIDVNAVQFSFPSAAPSAHPNFNYNNSLPQAGATMRTMTAALPPPEPEGPLDRLWAFFCPLKNSVVSRGGFSERLFGVTASGVVDLEKSATTTIAAPTSMMNAAGGVNCRWESSPPPPYFPTAPGASNSYPSSPISPSTPPNLDPSLSSSSSSPPTSAAATAETPAPAWQARFARAARVPPFSTPVTRILSPVVTRAQWEIVVRSFLLAGLLSGMIIGGLLGVPVRH